MARNIDRFKEVNYNRVKAGDKEITLEHYFYYLEPQVYLSYQKGLITKREYYKKFSEWCKK